MQRSASLVLLLAVAFLPVAEAADSNPLGKVLELIDELAAKVTKDGEAEQKAFEEYTEWCDDTAKNSGFAIQDATKEIEKLEASIGEDTSAIQVCTTEIDNLAGVIATATSELG